MNTSGRKIFLACLTAALISGAVMFFAGGYIMNRNVQSKWEGVAQEKIDDGIKKYSVKDGKIDFQGLCKYILEVEGFNDEASMEIYDKYGFMVCDNFGSEETQATLNEDVYSVLLGNTKSSYKREDKNLTTVIPLMLGNKIVGALKRDYNITGLIDTRNNNILILLLFLLISAAAGGIIGMLMNKNLIKNIETLRDSEVKISQSELPVAEKSIDLQAKEAMKSIEAEKPKIESVDLKKHEEKKPPIKKEERIKSDPKLIMSQVNICDLIKDVSDMFAKKAYEKGVEFLYDFEDESLEVTVDVNAVRQVLINVIENAVKYSFKGGFIHLNATQNALDDIRVFIRDNGVGIAESEIKKVFDEQYSFGEDAGMGLGLTYAREIMEQHGGEIYINSVEGEGTEVILQFRKNSVLKSKFDFIAKKEKNDTPSKGNNNNEEKIEEVKEDSKEEPKEELKEDGPKDEEGPETLADKEKDTPMGEAEPKTEGDAAEKDTEQKENNARKRKKRKNRNNREKEEK